MIYIYTSSKCTGNFCIIHGCLQSFGRHVEITALTQIVIHVLNLLTSYVIFKLDCNKIGVKLGWTSAVSQRRKVSLGWRVFNSLLIKTTKINLNIDTNFHFINVLLQSNFSYDIFLNFLILFPLNIHLLLLAQYNR